MADNKPIPTFNVKFIGGPGISPAKVPLRAVSAALSAVQDLASGRDPLESRQVPDEKVIGLIGVSKGSAVYRCISRAPSEARQNLRLVGGLLSGDRHPEDNQERLARALKPIEKLSEVAKSINCRVEVALATKPKQPLFSIAKDDFANLSSRLFLSGRTTIIGTVKRVGGQVDMKCALSVPGRRHLLYCNVRSREVVRRLGQVLYQEVAAVGDVVWIHSSWHVYKFTINDFSRPQLGGTNDTIEKLRHAGLSAWDQIANPDEFVRGMRS